MDKTSLAIFSLAVAVLLGGLTIVGYGLHMFNTLQFLVGMATALTIGGACLQIIFGDDSWTR